MRRLRVRARTSSQPDEDDSDRRRPLPVGLNGKARTVQDAKFRMPHGVQSMLNRTRPLPASEQERRSTLLRHLRTGRLEDAAPECLLDPLRSPRPFVKLVAHYDKVAQLFLGNFSGAKIISTLVTLGTLAALGGVDLAELWAAVGIFVQAMPVLGNALGAV